LGALVGKYFAATLLLLIMLAAMIPSLLLLFVFGKPEVGPIVGGYLGLFLMGAAFVSLGLFISSLTENQIVAAAISFGLALLFWIMSWTATLTGDTVGRVVRQLSILEHLENFNKGILALSDVSFFVLFAAAFLFLTSRALETYRWRG